MTLGDANNILEKTYGEHLDTVYIPSLGRTAMFKPLTTAHVKLLTRSQFIDGFNLPVEILKLSLFDQLCAEDLKSEGISSKTITLYDYLAFLIGIRQMLESDLIFKFTCKCTPDKDFQQIIKLDELFDDIISDYKPQNETFEKVDEKTNIIWKFELSNFTMIDYLYYKHVLIKLKQNETNFDIVNTDLYLRPLLYIKKVYMNDEQITDWNTLIITQKLKFFNKISPNVTINSSKNNKTLMSFIKNNFAEEKLIKFIKDLSVECPQCHKKYRRVYDLDNFFMFSI